MAVLVGIRGCISLVSSVQRSMDAVVRCVTCTVVSYSVSQVVVLCLYLSRVQ